MPATVEELLAAYVGEHREQGRANPLPYLEQVDDAERDELAALIDAYLVDAPGRKWDAAAFHGSAAERLTDRLERSLTGVSGEWPLLLPSLRHRARLTRTELVEKLGDEIGAAGDGADAKIDSYYHEMEHGLLPSAGVSRQVLDALGRILDTTADILQRAGAPLGSQTGGHPGPVFARTAGQPETGEALTAPPPVHQDRLPSLDEPDSIDLLFRKQED